MERLQKSSRLDMETKYIAPEIMNSPCGYKMVIPVFNDIVPQYYKDLVLQTASIFMREYFFTHGEALDAGSIYVDGQLTVYLNENLSLDNKYRLYIVIYIKRECDFDSQDYVVEIPISPFDVHFGEFRQCIMRAFEMMVDGVEKI